MVLDYCQWWWWWCAAYTHAASVAWPLSAIGWPRGAPGSLYESCTHTARQRRISIVFLQRLPPAKLAPGWSHGHQQ